MSKLYNLTTKEKYTYLFTKVYENVTTSNGRLLISTYWCRKVSEILGGDYDSLSKMGKIFFKDDIIEENIIIENGFKKYTEF